MTLIHNATEYHGYGLQSTPARWPEKSPLGPWKSLQDNLQTVEETQARFREQPSAVAMGFFTGAASGGLEVIDVDCKYDLTGNLYPELWRLIEGNLPDLATKLPIIKTKSGGYHLYYRCAEIEGNKKLARRPATPEEKAKNPNEKVVVLIETRGTGGFIVAPPTPGYVLESGSFSSIPTITSQERGQLLQICRSLNEYSDPEPDRQTRQSGGNGQAATGDVAPWDDYNQRGDVVSLLEQHGWTVVFEQSDRVHLKRPGSSTAKTSANFHEGLRKFIVHSSSTEFEQAPTAYSPFDVFKVLRGITHNGEAAKELRAMGYGSASTYEPQQKSAKATTIRVEATDGNGETTNMNKDGVVNEEAAKGKTVDAVYVYFTETSDPVEIRKSAALLGQANANKVFLRQVTDLSDTSTFIEELRLYEYIARGSFQRYAKAAAEHPEGVPVSEEESIIREFVEGGLTLPSPLDRRRYQELFNNFVEHNGLGIPPKALDEELEKLNYDLQREKQREHFGYLLRDAAEKEKQGEIGGAFDLLINRSKALRSMARQDSFGKLATPTSKEAFADRLKNKPLAIDTGYKIARGKIPIKLPAGAITVIAAPTSHGKTTLLSNLALRAAAAMPEKSIYLLSYEEDADAVTVSTLSIYVGKKLGESNRDAIRSYYRGYPQDIDKEELKPFETKSQEFFSELIEPGRLSIQYIDYDSDSLCDALEWLAKHGNAGAVFIDYFQLLRKVGENQKQYATRQLELQSICTDLKNVAVDTGLALVLGAQFTREVKGPEKMLATRIREAADIEHVANLIIGCWDNSQPLEGDEKEIGYLPGPYDYGPDQMYMRVLKNRGGIVNVGGMFSYEKSIGLIDNKIKSPFSPPNKPAFDAV